MSRFSVVVCGGGVAGMEAVHVVGSPNLTQLYATGLEQRQCKSYATDGSDAVLAGLTQIRKQLVSHVI